MPTNFGIRHAQGLSVVRVIRARENRQEPRRVVNLVDLLSCAGETDRGRLEARVFEDLLAHEHALLRRVRVDEAHTVLALVDMAPHL